MYIDFITIFLDFLAFFKKFVVCCRWLRCIEENAVRLFSGSGVVWLKVLSAFNKVKQHLQSDKCLRFQTVSDKDFALFRFINLY